MSRKDTKNDKMTDDEIINSMNEIYQPETNNNSAHPTPNPSNSMSDEPNGDFFKSDTSQHSSNHKLTTKYSVKNEEGQIEEQEWDELVSSRKLDEHLKKQGDVPIVRLEDDHVEQSMNSNTKEEGMKSESVKVKNHPLIEKIKRGQEHNNNNNNQNNNNMNDEKNELKDKNVQNQRDNTEQSTSNTNSTIQPSMQEQPTSYSQNNRTREFVNSSNINMRQNTNTNSNQNNHHIQTHNLNSNLTPNNTNINSNGNNHESSMSDEPTQIRQWNNNHHSQSENLSDHRIAQERRAGLHSYIPPTQNQSNNTEGIVERNNRLLSYLTDMGQPIQESRRALNASNWDPQVALQQLRQGVPEPAVVHQYVSFRPNGTVFSRIFYHHPLAVHTVHLSSNHNDASDPHQSQTSGNPTHTQAHHVPSANISSPSAAQTQQTPESNSNDSRPGNNNAPDVNTQDNHEVPSGNVQPEPEPTSDAANPQEPQDRFVHIQDSLFSINPSRPVENNRRVNFSNRMFVMPLDYTGRGFFDISFFSQAQAPLAPNFYDFEFVTNVMEQFMNRQPPSNPVSRSLFQRETKKLKVRHRPKDEDFNCSICFDNFIYDPSEIDELSKEQLKELKTKFNLTEPDLTELKAKLKEVLADEETDIPDSVLISKCKHAFHTECIQKWFKDHNTCPLCRLELKEE